MAREHTGDNVLNLEKGAGGVARNRQKFEGMKALNAGDVGEAPAWLDERMQRVWDTYVEHYDATGVLCELDRPALASLCVTIVKLTDVDQLLAATEDVADLKTYLNIKKQLMADFKTFSDLFGSSPKQRASLLAALQESKIDTGEQDPLLAAL